MAEDRPAGPTICAEAWDELSGMRYRTARRRVLDELEGRYLRQLMDRSKGNVSLASRISGIHRSQLIAMLKRWPTVRRGAP